MLSMSMASLQLTTCVFGRQAKLQEAQRVASELRGRLMESRNELASTRQLLELQHDGVSKLKAQLRMSTANEARLEQRIAHLQSGPGRTAGQQRQSQVGRSCVTLISGTSPLAPKQSKMSCLAPALARCAALYCRTKAFQVRDPSCTPVESLSCKWVGSDTVMPIILSAQSMVSCVPAQALAFPAFN